MLRVKEFKISIVIATLNSAKTIEQSLLSVINQTYKYKEIIVIDGGSKDGTINILKKYKEYITIWISEPDFGIYDAYNKGVFLSQGDYICFLGSDDSFCNKNTLENVGKYLNKKVDILCTNVWQVDEKYAIQKLSFCKKEYEKIRDSRSMPHHQGMFIKSSLVKMFKFDIKYKIAADYDLFLKIYFIPGINIKCVNINSVYFSFGLGASSNLYKSIDEYINIMKIHGIKSGLLRENIKKIYIILFIRKYLTDFIMRLCMKLNLLYYLKRNNGWEKHRCDLKKCRWCRKE